MKTEKKRKCLASYRKELESKKVMLQKLQETLKNDSEFFWLKLLVMQKSILLRSWGENHNIRTEKKTQRDWKAKRHH